MRKTRLVIQPIRCLHTIGFLLLYLSSPTYGDWGLIKPDSAMVYRAIEIEREGVRPLVRSTPDELRKSASDGSSTQRPREWIKDKATKDFEIRQSRTGNQNIVQHRREQREREQAYSTEQQQLPKRQIDRSIDSSTARGIQRRYVTDSRRIELVQSRRNSQELRSVTDFRLEDFVQNSRDYNKVRSISDSRREGLAPNRRDSRQHRSVSDSRMQGSARNRQDSHQIRSTSSDSRRESLSHSGRNSQELQSVRNLRLEDFVKNRRDSHKVRSISDSRMEGLAPNRRDSRGHQSVSDSRQIRSTSSDSRRESFSQSRRNSQEHRLVLDSHMEALAPNRRDSRQHQSVPDPRMESSAYNRQNSRQIRSTSLDSRRESLSQSLRNSQEQRWGLDSRMEALASNRRDSRRHQSVSDSRLESSAHNRQDSRQIRSTSSDSRREFLSQSRRNSQELRSVTNFRLEDLVQNRRDLHQVRSISDSRREGFIPRTEDLHQHRSVSDLRRIASSTNKQNLRQRQLMTDILRTDTIRGRQDLRQHQSEIGTRRAILHRGRQELLQRQSVLDTRRVGTTREREDMRQSRLVLNTAQDKQSLHQRHFVVDAKRADSTRNQQNLLQQTRREINRREQDARLSRIERNQEENRKADNTRRVYATRLLKARSRQENEQPNGIHKRASNREVNREELNARQIRESLLKVRQVQQNINYNSMQSRRAEDRKCSSSQKRLLLARNQKHDRLDSKHSGLKDKGMTLVKRISDNNRRVEALPNPRYSPDARLNGEHRRLDSSQTCTKTRQQLPVREERRHSDRRDNIQNSRRFLEKKDLKENVLRVESNRLRTSRGDEAVRYGPAGERHLKNGFDSDRQDRNNVGRQSEQRSLTRQVLMNENLINRNERSVVRDTKVRTALTQTGVRTSKERYDRRSEGYERRASSSLRDTDTRGKSAALIENGREQRREKIERRSAQRESTRQNQRTSHENISLVTSRREGYAEYLGEGRGRRSEARVYLNKRQDTLTATEPRRNGQEQDKIRRASHPIDQRLSEKAAIRQITDYGIRRMEDKYFTFDKKRYSQEQVDKLLAKHHTKGTRTQELAINCLIGAAALYMYTFRGPKIVY